jgi:hypothetical protein
MAQLIAFPESSVAGALSVVHAEAHDSLRMISARLASRAERKSYSCRGRADLCRKPRQGYCVLPPADEERDANVGREDCESGSPPLLGVQPRAAAMSGNGGYCLKMIDPKSPRNWRQMNQKWAPGAVWKLAVKPAFCAAA